MDMLGKMMGDDTVNKLRFPEIMADAAYVILTRDSKNYTRNFCIDEDILREVGVTNFDVYAVKPGRNYKSKLLKRIFCFIVQQLSLLCPRNASDAGLLPWRIPQ